MIRPFLTELLLFATPFVAYAVFLWLTRAGVMHPQSWRLSIVLSLTIVGLILVIGSFVVLALYGGAPPGSTYVPAHMEDGKLVPGTAR